VNKIAVLMTCFNRKDMTLKSLGYIYDSQGIKRESLSIFLVNDGCTDGTSEAVKLKFPDINIINGNGTLFWNGGMRVAWAAALAKGGFEYFLWVNDDSYIYDDSIARLIFSHKLLVKKGMSPGAVLGTMVDSVNEKPTYGGRRKNSLINPVSFGPVLIPENTSIPCDFVNGNLTLIPAETVKKIGILSDQFTHSMGDFDYGLRAIKAGLNCWVAPGVYGECEENSVDGSWQDKSLSLDVRVNKMKNITQLPPFREWSVFIQRHCGWKWPLLYLDALIRDKLPKVWLVIKRKI
jgi:GT2 family glycosyltransferase